MPAVMLPCVLCQGEAIASAGASLAAAQQQVVAVGVQMLHVADACLAMAASKAAAAALQAAERAVAVECLTATASLRMQEVGDDDVRCKQLAENVHFSSAPCMCPVYIRTSVQSMYTRLFSGVLFPPQGCQRGSFDWDGKTALMYLCEKQLSAHP